MKRAALYMMLVLAIAICPMLVQAQSNQILKANIPFNFTAGSAQMPSGAYIVESTFNNAQLLRSPETKATAFVMSNSIGNPNRTDLSKYVLVFHRYGSEYVLSEIWAGGVGHQVRQPKRVTELAKSEKPEKTIVAMVVSK